MNEYDYTGDKTKNSFTAYLQKSIRWKRQNYLKKKERTYYMERLLEEDMLSNYSITMEDMLEICQKEELLLQERIGDYPQWGELADQKLVYALMLLCKNEKRIIYQHVFEERSFKEMAYLNGLSVERVKSIYYYAVRKICKWMGGEK